MEKVWLIEKLDNSLKYMTDDQVEIEKRKGNFLKKIKKLEL